MGNNRFLELVTLTLAFCNVLGCIFGQTDAVDQKLNLDQYFKNMLKDFQALNQWVEENIKSNDPKVLLDYVIENSDAFFEKNLNHSGAIHYLIELSTVGKCNDRSLDLARVYYEESYSMQKYTKANKMLEYYTKKKIEDCADYIDNKFELLLEGRRRKMFAAPDISKIQFSREPIGSSLKDKDPIYQEFLKQLVSYYHVLSTADIEKIILTAAEKKPHIRIWSETQYGSGIRRQVFHKNIRNIYENYVVKPCSEHIQIMRNFYKSVKSYVFFMYRRKQAIDFFRNRSMEFQKDYYLYLVCSHIRQDIDFDLLFNKS